MSKVRLTGSTSGYTEIQASAVAGDNTLSLPTTTDGTLVATDTNGEISVSGGNIGGFDVNASAGANSVNLDASGRLLVGTSSSIGATPAAMQIKGITGGSPKLAVLSGNNEEAGSYGLYSSSTNSLWINADPDDLRANSLIVFSVDATERMRITNNGTILIGTTDTNPAVNNLSAGTSVVGGFVESSNSNEILARFNRKDSDGNLVEFRQDGTTEGTISVSGTTVSYNGAHLSRWSQLVGIDPYDKATRPEILRGTVMSNLDEMCDWTCPTSGECQDNEQLNKTEVSSVDDDPNVAGVFQSWDDDDDTWVNDFYLAMTGDFVIRIAAGTTVQRGDLLCSAGDGTARPQGDRYIKDSTIAKVTSTTVSCTHPDGSYCVPCVLMAC